MVLKLVFNIIVNMLFCFNSMFFAIGQIKNFKPPTPEKILKELVAHGDKRFDCYFWMNDKNNPKVIEYLNAENKYTETFLKPTEKLQKTLYKEMVSRIKTDEESVPYEFNGYFYYSRYEPGSEYPIHFRKKRNLSAKEEILLNIDRLSKGYKVFKVSGLFISPDNNILAFGVDTMGDQRNTITFIDIKKGVFLDDILKNTNGNLVWANDNKTVFYCTLDETVRSYKVFKHTLGTPTTDDIEIFYEADKTFEVNISKSKTGEYIFISTVSTNSSMVCYFSSDDLVPKFKVIQAKQQDLLYSVEQRGDKFIIRTNDNAKNFKIVETSIEKPQKEYWIDLVPHKANTLIQGFSIFKDYLAIDEKIDGVPKIQIIDGKNNSEYYIDFPEEAYQIFFGDNRIYNTNVLRFRYTSLTTPLTTFDYNMLQKTKKLIKSADVLGGYNKDKYETKRLFATAVDGTKIPISIVYKKGVQKNGKNPLLLVGYGAYGNSNNPGFSSDRISLLDRGFIFAIAHIRGGQEMGRYWYEEGKMLKKKNTFTDFISCAEYLIAEKYTNPDKLFANGRSAGGLLMSAVANIRPDLFRGIIAEVPWVDVVTDMFNEDLPLTTLEYDEWGNPNNKEYYDYMLSYSPYDNVQHKKYPAIFATGGLNDTQVPYWNPAKWVAKLREMKTDNNVVLLKTNMEAGHSGASGRFETNKLTAQKYAFMLYLLGINK